jgi:hypothetical protein
MCRQSARIAVESRHFGWRLTISGWPGPPVLINRCLPARRRGPCAPTLLAFFAVSYGVTLAASLPPPGLRPGILPPFAFLGGLAGRPIGDRLGAEAFAMLAITLLGMAGAYTFGDATIVLASP